jgi:hypothetical protein
VRITDRERDMLRCWRRRWASTVPREALAAPGGGANERTVDVQINRLRRKIERDPANPIICKPCAGRAIGLRGSHDAAQRCASSLAAGGGAVARFRRGWLRRLMPKGLFARSLLIVILPMVLLQSVSPISSWSGTGSGDQRLSAALTQDIAGADRDARALLARPTEGRALAAHRARQAGARCRLPAARPLPPALPKPFFSKFSTRACPTNCAADRPAVLSRYGGQVQSDRNPRPAR